MTFFALGFRPFFVGATLYALFASVVWLLVLSFGVAPTVLGRFGGPFAWHGHEMVFGYGLAVVAGFLLTAAKNWTGVPTVVGTRLMLLVGLWFLPRVIMWSGLVPLTLVAALDVSFGAALVWCVCRPLVVSGQWLQVQIYMSKLGFLAVCNAVFYLGLMGYYSDGVRVGLYGGVYLIVALILTLGRRVFPFFILKALGVDVAAGKSKILDYLSLAVFLTFAIADIFAPDSIVVPATAIVLVAVHVIRLSGWYVHGVWRMPMVWVLLCGYAWLIIGFGLKAAASVTEGLVSPYAALHAFTYGGIGVTTIGMMVRVTLGHTGRRASKPPTIAVWIFLLINLGAVIRVLGPLGWASATASMVSLSLIPWLLAFGAFAVIFVPQLVAPRVDGQPG